MREARDELLSLLESELLLGVQSRIRKFLARKEGDAEGLLCCLHEALLVGRVRFYIFALEV